MKLVVPYAGDMQPPDARLIHLAEFFGIPCEKLALHDEGPPSPGFLDGVVDQQNTCFVVNPQVIGKWLSTDASPHPLASYLASRCPVILVHGLHPDAHSTSTVSALSEDRLRAVKPVDGPGLSYRIAAGYTDICGAFSGLDFGPVNVGNDCVLTGDPHDVLIRPLITISGQPFFASIQRDQAEIFFLASRDIADLDANVDNKPLTDYFSQLVPVAMLLRHVFGKACWHPNQHHATLIIDDPLLRRQYGFLNYERLLKLMDDYNFHSSIAFIPYNYRRSSPLVTRIFRERPDRYSICFHGNDHTAAEFATKDVSLLNALLNTAVARLGAHQKKTGIRCDKVMVFPQGKFSVEAMRALKAHNFVAAVNSGAYPLGEPRSLSLAEVIQPAVLKYDAFPLFLRKYVHNILPQDVAFNLFVGKPVFIVEHHEIFKDSNHLTELVSRINTLAPDIQWSNVQTAIENSYLRRVAQDGTCHVRAYSNAGRINNDSQALLHCYVEWHNHSQSLVEKVLLDGEAWPYTVDDASIRFSFDLAPGASRSFSVIYRRALDLSNANRRLQWTFKAFLRRRLSEIRDNYLSV